MFLRNVTVAADIIRDEKVGGARIAYFSSTTREKMFYIKLYTIVYNY